MGNGEGSERGPRWWNAFCVIHRVPLQFSGLVRTGAVHPYFIEEKTGRLIELPVATYGLAKLWSQISLAFERLPFSLYCSWFTALQSSRTGKHHEYVQFVSYRGLGWYWLLFGSLWLELLFFHKNIKWFYTYILLYFETGFHVSTIFLLYLSSAGIIGMGYHTRLSSFVS